MGKNKKIKIKKETRDEAARRKFREKVEKREIAYGMQKVLANKKSDYIRNIINGRYYLARCNMIAASSLVSFLILIFLFFPIYFTSLNFFF